MREGGGKLVRPGRPAPAAWLEPDATDEEESEGALDTRRILTVIIGGLALLAVLGGLGWWLVSSARNGEDVVADGSIIRAPDAPYKVRPADPGGMEVAGTGNVSFAVAEGEVREGQIVEPAPPDDAQGAGAVGVQIGAFPSREEASEGWARMGVRIPALAGRSHRILEGDADMGAVFRLQALAASRADAEALCDAIRAEGGDCQVKN